MGKHYHVNVGMGGGYLPNATEYHETKASALRSAAWHIADIASEEDEAEYVKPRRKVGNLRRDGMVVFSRGGYDLGMYVEVVPCEQDGCADDDTDS